MVNIQNLVLNFEEIVVLLNMDVQSRADILAKMQAENAAKLTAIMQPEK